MLRFFFFHPLSLRLRYNSPAPLMVNAMPACLPVCLSIPELASPTAAGRLQWRELQPSLAFTTRWRKTLLRRSCRRNRLQGVTVISWPETHADRETRRNRNRIQACKHKGKSAEEKKKNGRSTTGRGQKIPELGSSEERRDKQKKKRKPFLSVQSFCNLADDIMGLNIEFLT